MGEVKHPTGKIGLLHVVDGHAGIATSFLGIGKTLNPIFWGRD